MARTPSIVSAQTAHIRSLYIVIVALVAIAAYAMSGWRNAPKDLRIHLPPDLRSGAVTRPDELHGAHIYNFANQTMRALNRWETNGEEDYGKRIREFEYRLTEEYKEQLLREMNRKHADGELRNRTRYVIERAGFERYEKEYVVPLEDDSWLVWIDLVIKERTGSIEAKNVTVRYPMRVVRVNISPEKNPWGLAIDGYPRDLEPRRLTASELEGDVELPG